MSPLPFQTDQAALNAALPIIGMAEPPDAKLQWIHNTLELAEVECGSAYLPLARERENLEILTEPAGWVRDAAAVGAASTSSGTRNGCGLRT